MASLLSKALPSTVREVRFLFCQTSKASAPLRSFIDTKYAEIKAKNPNLPLLIREAQGTPPRAFIRFEKGREVQVPMTSATNASDVEKLLNNSLSQ